MTEYSHHHRLIERTDDDLDLALTVLGHPSDVVDNPRLSRQQKRAVLASWASDANAVPRVPTLRQLPDGSIVKVDEILDALKALDGLVDPASWPGHRGKPWQRRFKRDNTGWIARKWFKSGRGPDDDDDPPPCPALAAIRPKGGGGPAFAEPESAAA
jgi:hypothetical protein